MIGYQPNFRPVVRAQMAQTAPPPAAAQPPTVKIPADVADQTATALSTAQNIRTVALVASGLGVVGGGLAAYCSYTKGKEKGKLGQAVVASGVFALINVILFGYVVTK